MILWSSAWHLIFLLQILQFATNSFDGNLYHFQFQLLSYLLQQLVIVKTCMYPVSQ